MRLRLRLPRRVAQEDRVGANGKRELSITRHLAAAITPKLNPRPLARTGWQTDRGGLRCPEDINHRAPFAEAHPIRLGASRDAQVVKEDRASAALAVRLIVEYQRDQAGWQVQAQVARAADAVVAFDRAVNRRRQELPAGAADKAQTKLERLVLAVAQPDLQRVAAAVAVDPHAQLRGVAVNRGRRTRREDDIIIAARREVVVELPSGATAVNLGAALGKGAVGLIPPPPRAKVLEVEDGCALPEIKHASRRRPGKLLIKRLERLERRLGLSIVGVAAAVAQQAQPITSVIVLQVIPEDALDPGSA